jgi:hypothetical protein
MATGTQYVDGRIPGQRIATDIQLGPSSNISTETEMQSVDAPVTDGRTYRLTWFAPITASNANNIALGRLREDDVSGNELSNAGRIEVVTAAGTYPLRMEAEYLADATEVKTFSATLDFVSGTGTVAMDAGTARPSYLYVDYIRG